jgi:hypothetical protein
MKGMIAEREVMAHQIMQNTDLCDKSLTYFGLGSEVSETATLMALALCDFAWTVENALIIIG